MDRDGGGGRREARGVICWLALHGWRRPASGCEEEARYAFGPVAREETRQRRTWRLFVGFGVLCRATRRLCSGTWLFFLEALEPMARCRRGEPRRASRSLALAVELRVWAPRAELNASWVGKLLGLAAQGTQARVQPPMVWRPSAPPTARRLRRCRKRPARAPAERRLGR